MQMKVERQSNFELLRIICIAMIIGFHYVLKGGFDFSEKSGWELNRLIYDIFYHFGELGVNIFVLISGYFVSKSTYHWNKVMTLSMQALFYVILCRAVLVCFGYCQWNHWSIKSYLFPILIPKYWFLTAYALIYTLSPYIKRLVENINQQEYKKLLLVWFLVWSVFPTIILGFFYGSTNTEDVQNYNRFIWLIGVYLAGAYISRYEMPKVLQSLKNRVVCLLICTLALLIYIGIAEYRGDIYGHSSVYFWPPNSILEILLSIFIFLVFEKVNIPYNKVINYIASCTLGIYMLHDGGLVSFWWNDIFHNATHQTSSYFICYILFAIVLIMIIGVITESFWKMLCYLEKRLHRKYL